jgi:hypothetical protein
MEEKTNNTEEKTKKNAFSIFLWKHKIPLILLVIIGVLLLYYNLKINSIESSHLEEMNSTIQNYNLQIDSIQIFSLTQTIKVYSWAIRSELIRNNIEQVNQFFLAFIKEKGVEQIDLINPETSVITLSTDMKQEGKTITDSHILQAESTVAEQDSTGLRIVSPIMGLEKKIGIISVKIKE